LLLNGSTCPHTYRKKKNGHIISGISNAISCSTLGFFVENQREHIVERQRATQYAKALLRDLEKDIVEIRDVMRENKNYTCLF
jgi:hypothetical protein